MASMSRNVLLSNSSSDSLGCSNFRNNQPGSIETFQTPLNVTVSPDIPDSSQPLYIFIKSYLVLAALTALNHLGRQQCFQQMTAASPATTQITAAVNPKFNDNEHADGHVDNQYLVFAWFMSLPQQPKETVNCSKTANPHGIVISAPYLVSIM